MSDYEQQRMIDRYLRRLSVIRRDMGLGGIDNKEALKPNFQFCLDRLSELLGVPKERCCP